jgi:hypothetical protein
MEARLFIYLFKNRQSLPSSDDSAKNHVTSFWACHNDLPCDPFWSIRQVGTVAAQ